MYSRIVPCLLLILTCAAAPACRSRSPDSLPQEQRPQAAKTPTRGSLMTNYPNFIYPSVNLQDAELAGYFQDIDTKLLSQSVDTTLREMTYLAEPGSVGLFLAEVEESEVWPRTTRLNAGVLLQRWDMLGKLDTETGPAFVHDAVKRNDVDALCVALLANSPSDVGIVDGLRRLNDDRSVRSLAYYLGVLIGHPTVSLGGAQYLHDRDVKASYAALFIITGVAPADFKDTSDDAIRTYLDEVENWVNEILAPIEVLQ